MAHRPQPSCAPKQKFPKAKAARDPIAAIERIDPDMPPVLACVAIVSRTRRVFKARRAS